MELEEVKGEVRSFRFLKGPSREIIVQCYVEGLLTSRDYYEIINSVPEKPDVGLLRKWQEEIAGEISKQHRKHGQQPFEVAAISLSFFFNSEIRSKPFDIDNFTKPLIDAVASGLSENPIPVGRFNANDSAFRWMYFERDDKNKGKEGVQITVCLSN